MPRIIDLDLIAPTPVVIRKTVGGRLVELPIPGDPPVELWLGIVDAHDRWASSDNADANDALQVYHDRMLALFRVETPDLERLPFGLDGMFAVLSGFYSVEDVDEPDPPRAEEASTKRTTRSPAGSRASKPRTTPSRSSRSSGR